MPTQRPGTRSGLAPSLRPRNLGATKDTRLPPPGAAPLSLRKCAPQGVPRSRLGRSPRPPGRPVTLTGGLPGSGLRPVTRPRPPRRERLPRAGTGSRAGQVRVSAASAHRGPLDPLRTGGPRPPPGADAGAAAPPEGHLQAPRGTRDPRPHGRVTWEPPTAAPRTRGRRPGSREGRAHAAGKEDGGPVGAPRARAPPGTLALASPLPAAPGWRWAHGHAGVGTRARTRTRGLGHADTETWAVPARAPAQGPALRGAGRGAHPAERASGGVTCAAR